MQVDENDIAIVGMAIRVPGASTPEQYWANLRDGVESLTELSEETLLERGVSRSTLADPNYVRAAMILEDVDQFDPEFFGFSAKEAAILDPQHRQFYEVCWEALERAGHPPAAFDGAIGVFAGCGMGAYFAYNILTNSELLDSVGLFLLRHTGNDKDFLATRVSYSFDLKGPGINVQTACSTSLVAAHMGVQSLLSGETDMVLAGGVTIEIPHGVGYHYKEGEILSPDGHCRSFDHKSKGTVFGSGTGVVVLRRLADAIEDGDHIHAVIKGTAVNNDGSGKVGYLAPSVEGQAAAVAEALAVADVDASTIGYVECHGTGTPVGDPIEIAALTRAFRETTDESGYCRVGSVKSNIGHLDTAAGVASLIKAALALEHGQIPPSLNFEAPNPAIAFDGSPFVVAAELSNWGASLVPRRAGVNSLGVGGTNAFVVLEEPPKKTYAQVENGAQLIALSARSRRALDDASQNLAAWLRQNPDTPLQDIAFSLLQGRHGFEFRRVVGVNSHAEAAELLEQGDARRVYTHTREIEKPNVVFMYPGGGAQYFRMARDLYDCEPVFRQQVDVGLKILRERFGSDLTSVFLAAEGEREAVTTELEKPSVQLPLTFLVEYSLTQLLAHYGVTPTALIGHSMGENTAACVAGVFSFADGLGLVLLRGQLMDEVPEGGMLSVPMPVDELRDLIGDELDIAAANSPQLSVASGHNQLLDELTERLKAQGIDSQRVRINIAAHSRLLENITGRFREYLASIQLNEPALPIVSNRTGEWLVPEKARSPDYWVEHLRNTVLFSKGIETLLQEGDSVFIEVGPGSTLGSFVRQNPNAPAQRVFGSMRHPDAEVADSAHFKAMLGRMWAVGAEFDIDKLWSQKPQRVPLPTYPFQHSSFWIEPGKGKVADDSDLLRPLRADKRDDWYWEPKWIQQGVVDSSAEPGTWWVFHEREPLAEKLIADLRARGNRVVSILAGDTYARLSDDSFTLAPDAGGAGYQDLVETLADEGLLPDRILHTWLVTWDDSHRPGSSFFHRNQNFGFYSLFYLARALSKSVPEESGAHWLVLANGIHRIKDEVPGSPEKATVEGPCAVIPRELPGTTVSLVDIDLEVLPAKLRRKISAAERDQQASALAGELAVEMLAAPATTTIAWRNGARWQRRIVPASVPDSSATKLRQGGVYLITGGLGGIGGLIAEWLAREYNAKLVLIGRTPLPDREQWDDWLLQHDVKDSISRGIMRVRELESSGASVLAVAADVTVADQVRSAVDEAESSFGVINGVIHAAGVIRDNLIPLKSQRDIEEVFAAKVYGTLVLDEIFAEKKLDFLLLFSSVSTVTAPQGQIDYVGANAYLNAYAEACRQRRPYPVIAANWGIWRDVGMVAPVATGKRSDGDAEAERGTTKDLDHPLFSRSIASRSGTLEVRIFEGEFSAEDDWVIDEHRLIGGEALLPGTGYAELIRSALALLSETIPWRISNLVFQRPLFVRDGQPRKFRVRLRGGRGRWDAEILSAPVDGSAGRWDVCAMARVGGDSGAELSNVPVSEIEQRLSGETESAAGTGTLRTSQEAHLRFGANWRVLKRIDYGQGEALARLELAEALRPSLADFGLHPGLLDIATGCAMNLIPGYAEQDAAENLWVPISYRSIRYFAPLEAQMISWLRIGSDVSREAGFASFNVTISNPEGKVLVEVEGLTLRQLQGTLRASEFDQSPESIESAEGDRVDSRQQKLSPSEAALQHNLSLGIRPAEGLQVIEQLLAADPGPEIIVSSIRPPDLLKQADAVVQASNAGSSGATFSRPELESDFESPRNDVEKGLADVWGKLLGVEGIGIHDSFFDLGGHSLIAVRLFNEVNDRFGVDLPMSVLMQRPTIAALAEMVGPVDSSGDESGDSSESVRPALEFQFVVPMHAGPVAGETPLFVVAGMFGNVLNLSHLAHLLGEDRPFYALQARGLYGDSEPHQSFEEAAADYIDEIKKVQPSGPYLLGGYSGGGITAYEMARQLIEAGEDVARVILLDSPLAIIPQFSRFDRISMLRQRLQRGGAGYLLEKLGARVARLVGRGDSLESGAGNSASADDTIQFQSQRIGDAFMQSVASYETRPVDVDITLFRPKLDVRYVLSGGRRVNADQEYIYEDNGWTQYVRSIDVIEVPGNHDSMVLEPNVRVLVASLKRSIDASLRGDKS